MFTHACACVLHSVSEPSPLRWCSSFWGALLLVSCILEPPPMAPKLQLLQEYSEHSKEINKKILKGKFQEGSTYPFSGKQTESKGLLECSVSDIFSHTNCDLFSHVIIVIADILSERSHRSWLAFSNCTRQLSNLIRMYDGKSDTLYLA